MFAWPEPLNAKCEGMPAGARYGVRGALASGGIEHKRPRRLRDKFGEIRIAGVTAAPWRLLRTHCHELRSARLAAR